MDERASIPVTLPVENPTASYWHDPPSPLANYGTTRTLPDFAETIIIGSGISGTMIAWNLLEAGARDVLLLEARSAVGGATGRNDTISILLHSKLMKIAPSLTATGGHTKAGSYRSFLHNVSNSDAEDALKIAKLEHDNIRTTHKLAREYGIDCGSRECHTVDLIYDAGMFSAGKNAIEKLKEAFERDGGKAAVQEGGAGWYQIHRKEDAMSKFFVAHENSNPWVVAKRGGPEAMQGAFEYAAGSISAYRFASGMLKLCVKRGLNLQTHTAVTGFGRIARPDYESTGDPRWEVRTPRGSVRTKCLILATNGYTVRLLPSLQKLIVPLRGQIQALRPGPKTKLPAPLPTTYSFIYGSGYEYMIPRAVCDYGHDQQHIVMGGGIGRLPYGGASEFGTCDDSTTNREITAYLSGTGQGYFGANWGESTQENDRIVKEWTGIMGITPDDVPFVGQVPEPLLPSSSADSSAFPGSFSKGEGSGLYISAGFNGHGMVLCLKCAEALGTIIRGQDVPDWFPRSFLITEERVKRLKSKEFEGRRTLGSLEA